jgi:hypothetical protein
MEAYGLFQKKAENNSETNRQFGSRSKCQRAICKKRLNQNDHHVIMLSKNG